MKKRLPYSITPGNTPRKQSGKSDSSEETIVESLKIREATFTRTSSSATLNTPRKDSLNKEMVSSSTQIRAKSRPVSAISSVSSQVNEKCIVSIRVRWPFLTRWN